MASISYSYSNGVLYGFWTGKSVRTSAGPRKEGQFRIGRVVDKENLIFFNNEYGFFKFEPETQARLELAENELPENLDAFTDQRRAKSPCLITFGSVFFMFMLILGIGYNTVVDSIAFRNRDSLNTLIQYYVLSNMANNHAYTWHENNLTKYLYPKANLQSQRVSELLASIGKPDKRRAFLTAHIEYVLSTLDRDVAIIVDSTGMPNACDIPITRLSTHGNKTNNEFRVIVVVEISTGLPIYYEVINGNIIDSSTLKGVIANLKEYNCNVKFTLLDAGYCYPNLIEHLVFHDIGFMSRLNPHHEMMKNAINDHLDHLNEDENLIKYNGRFIYVKKIETIIATDKETHEERKGYIYLCRDVERYNTQMRKILDLAKNNSVTKEEFKKLKRKLGVFALVTTENLSKEEAVPFYYIRQGGEQVFDFGKNYAKFLPVRQHNMETLSGHIMLAFIATFLIVLIKNRLNVANYNFVEITENLKQALSEDSNIIDVEGKIIVEQNNNVSKKMQMTTTLFHELECQKA